MRKLLTELCHPKQWKTIASKDLLSQGYPVYGANGLIGYWRDYNHNSDVLTIGCRGTCGALNIIGGKSYINGNAMCLDELSHDIYIRYLYYYLRWYDLRKIITGTTIPQITIQGLQKVWVDYPSIKKQSEIVYVLDKVNLIIDYYQQQLQKLDDLVKARFVELFGDGNHPHIALIDLIIEGAGLSYGIVQPGDDGTGDMGVLRPVDMVDGKISTASIKYIDRSIGDGFKKTELYGDELLITVRGTTGITALTDIRFNGMNVTRGIAVVRYDRNKINPVYLNAYLNTDESQRYIQEHTRGATLQQINLSDLRVQQIMVPPLALQEQMAAFIEQTDKSKFVESIHVLKLIKEAIAKEVSHDRIR